MNPYEEKRRAEKAYRLADFLQFQVGITDKSIVARMNEQQWQLAAAGAGVKMPSATTQSLVLAILGTRERVTCDGLRLDPYFEHRGQIA